jgi:hypothetical protein
LVLLIGGFNRAYRPGQLWMAQVSLLRPVPLCNRSWRNTHLFPG